MRAKVKSQLKTFLRLITDKLMLLVHYPVCFAVGLMPKHQKPRLVWGPVPMKNYEYACRAMQEAGHDAQTYVYEAYKVIYTNNDFDEIINQHWYYNIPVLGWLLRFFVFQHLAFLQSILRFDVFHFSFDGWCLSFTSIGHHEARLLRLAKKKTAVFSYGGDTFAYSRIHDPVQRHGLLLNYAKMAFLEPEVRKRNEYWSLNADVVVTNSMFDQIGRWDYLPFNYITIDESRILAKTHYSMADGVNGEVNVFHCPNHRGVKGTEFIVQAIEDLKSEGLKIKLTLIEKLQNTELLHKMLTEADILAEQLVLNAYGLNGIEAMATGLPVMCNIDSVFHTQVFRYYSYLDECPVVSATPHDVKDQLRVLVTNPHLRERLGRFGRLYVEKYHSRASARYLYESIARKVWYGDDVQSLNAYHPLKPNPLQKIHPTIHHGLDRNKLLIAPKPTSRSVEHAQFI